MNPASFQHFIAKVHALSASECIEVRKALKSREQNVEGSLLSAIL